MVCPPVYCEGDNKLFERMDSMAVDLKPGVKQNITSKRLYSLKEAAQYLGRSVWGMRELVWSERISCVRGSGKTKIFFDINDLNSFIEKNKIACQ